MAEPTSKVRRQRMMRRRGVDGSPRPRHRPTGRGMRAGMCLRADPAAAPQRSDERRRQQGPRQAGDAAASGRRIRESARPASIAPQPRRQHHEAERESGQHAMDGGRGLYGRLANDRLPRQRVRRPGPGREHRPSAEAGRHRQRSMNAAKLRPSLCPCSIHSSERSTHRRWGGDNRPRRRAAARSRGIAYLAPAPQTIVGPDQGFAPSSPLGGHSIVALRPALDRPSPRCRHV